MSVEKPKKRTRLLGALTGAGLVAAAAGGYIGVHHVVGGHGAEQPRVVKHYVPPVVTEKGLQQRNGVRITHVAVSGGGGLLDLRYQVVDPEKAAVVHGTTPEIVDETTGAVANKPFMGHTHTGVFHAGQTYFVLFENPGNLLHPGTRVTVVLGGLRVAHIRVE